MLEALLRTLPLPPSMTCVRVAAGHTHCQAAATLQEHLCQVTTLMSYFVSMQKLRLVKGFDNMSWKVILHWWSKEYLNNRGSTLLRIEMFYIIVGTTWYSGGPPCWRNERKSVIGPYFGRRCKGGRTLLQEVEESWKLGFGERNNQGSGRKKNWAAAV